MYNNSYKCNIRAWLLIRRHLHIQITLLFCSKYSLVTYALTKSLSSEMASMVMFGWWRRTGCCWCCPPVSSTQNRVQWAEELTSTSQGRFSLAGSLGCNIESPLTAATTASGVLLLARLEDQNKKGKSAYGMLLGLVGSAVL